MWTLTILIKYLEGLVQRGHVIRLNLMVTLDAALRKERREMKLKASRMVETIATIEVKVMVVKARVVIKEAKCHLRQRQGKPLA